MKIVFLRKSEGKTLQSLSENLREATPEEALEALKAGKTVWTLKEGDWKRIEPRADGEYVAIVEIKTPDSPYAYAYPHTTIVPFEAFKEHADEYWNPKEIYIEESV